MNCPYCGSNVSLRESTVVYRRDYGYKLWVCDNYPMCDAYVGAHKGSDRPKGTLANKTLRAWRNNAHKAFDPIWQGGRMNRGEAYDWLAENMGLTRERTHIGEFDVEQCKQVVRISTNYINGNNQ